MSKKNEPAEQPEQKTINDLSLVELKAVAYDLLSQKQMIDNGLIQVNAKIAEKMQTEQVSA